MVRVEDSGAEWIAPGQATRTGRTAHGGSGIEAIELNAIRRHLVEVRRFDRGVTVIADIAPTEVISHHEDHIGAVCAYCC